LYLLYLLDISEQVLLPALLDMVKGLQVCVDWLLVLLLMKCRASGLPSRWLVHSCYNRRTQSTIMLILSLIVLFFGGHLIVILLLVLSYFKVLPQSAHLLLGWHHIIVLLILASI